MIEANSKILNCPASDTAMLVIRCGRAGVLNHHNECERRHCCVKPNTEARLASEFRHKVVILIIILNELQILKTTSSYLQLHAFFEKVLDIL